MGSASRPGTAMSAASSANFSAISEASIASNIFDAATEYSRPGSAYSRPGSHFSSMTIPTIPGTAYSDLRPGTAYSAVSGLGSAGELGKYGGQSPAIMSPLPQPVR